MRDELTELMGSTDSRINFSSKLPTIIMMCGLQGSGKTTHSAKLARMFRKQGKRRCWLPVTFTVRLLSSS